MQWQATWSDARLDHGSRPCDLGAGNSGGLGFAHWACARESRTGARIGWHPDIHAEEPRRCNRPRRPSPSTCPSPDSFLYPLSPHQGSRMAVATFAIAAANGHQLADAMPYGYLQGRSGICAEVSIRCRSDARRLHAGDDGYNCARKVLSGPCR